jgi:hypothetical protein
MSAAWLRPLLPQEGEGLGEREAVQTSPGGINKGAT